MTTLREMTQSQVISWIGTIPTDNEFPSTLQQEIISGLKK